MTPARSARPGSASLHPQANHGPAVGEQRAGGQLGTGRPASDWIAGRRSGWQGAGAERGSDHRPVDWAADRPRKERPYARAAQRLGDSRRAIAGVASADDASRTYCGWASRRRLGSSRFAAASFFSAGSGWPVMRAASSRAVFTSSPRASM